MFEITVVKTKHLHVTPYFYNNPDKFRIFNYTNSEDLSHLSWTIYRIEDFKFVQQIVAKIKKRSILMKVLLELLPKEPELIQST